MSDDLRDRLRAAVSEQITPGIKALVLASNASGSYTARVTPGIVAEIAGGAAAVSEPIVRAEVDRVVQEALAPVREFTCPRAGQGLGPAWYRGYAAALADVRIVADQAAVAAGVRGE